MRVKDITELLTDCTVRIRFDRETLFTVNSDDRLLLEPFNDYAVDFVDIDGLGQLSIWVKMQPAKPLKV